MTPDRTPIHIHPDSELSLVLRRAAAARRPVLIDTGDAQYELAVQSAGAAPTAERTARTMNGIRAAAGGWKHLVDARAFTAALYQRRRMRNRPLVHL